MNLWLTASSLSEWFWMFCTYKIHPIATVEGFWLFLFEMKLNSGILSRNWQNDNVPIMINTPRRSPSGIQRRSIISCEIEDLFPIQQLSSRTRVDATRRSCCPASLAYDEKQVSRLQIAMCHMSRWLCHKATVAWFLDRQMCPASLSRQFPRLCVISVLSAPLNNSFEPKAKRVEFILVRTA